jgi:hypothetical protein
MNPTLLWDIGKCQLLLDGGMSMKGVDKVIPLLRGIPTRVFNYYPIIDYYVMKTKISARFDTKCARTAKYPIPGTVINRLAISSSLANVSISKFTGQRYSIAQLYNSDSSYSAKPIRIQPIFMSILSSLQTA